MIRVFSTEATLLSLNLFHILYPDRVLVLVLSLEFFLRPQCFSNTLLPQSILFSNFIRFYIVLCSLWIYSNLNLLHVGSPLGLLPKQFTAARAALCLVSIPSDIVGLFLPKQILSTKGFDKSGLPKFQTTILFYYTCTPSAHHLRENNQILYFFLCQLHFSLKFPSASLQKFATFS